MVKYKIRYKIIKQCKMKKLKDWEKQSNVSANYGKMIAGE